MGKIVFKIQRLNFIIFLILLLLCIVNMFCGFIILDNNLFLYWLMAVYVSCFLAAGMLLLGFVTMIFSLNREEKAAKSAYTIAMALVQLVLSFTLLPYILLHSVPV